MAEAKGVMCKSIYVLTAAMLHLRSIQNLLRGNELEDSTASHKDAG